MTNSTKIQILDTVKGSSFLAIQSTMEIFQRHAPDLGQSIIEVMCDPNSVVVILDSKDVSANTQKSIGVRLESKVELNAHDISILRSRMELIDRIHGGSFLPIKKGVEVFSQRYNPDLMVYSIMLVSEKDSVVVIFTDKDRPTGTRGSVGKPGFEVELNAEDLTVRRSNFVR